MTGTYLGTDTTKLTGSGSDFGIVAPTSLTITSLDGGDSLTGTGYLGGDPLNYHGLGGNFSFGAKVVVSTTGVFYINGLGSIDSGASMPFSLGLASPRYCPGDITSTKCLALDIGPQFQDFVVTPLVATH